MSRAFCPLEGGGGGQTYWHQAYTEKVTSPLVFDQRVSTGQGQAQQDQAAVPLHEHRTEGKQNILVLQINLTQYIF